MLKLWGKKRRNCQANYGNVFVTLVWEWCYWSYSPHCQDCDLWKVIWYFTSCVRCWICIPKHTRKSKSTAAFGNSTHHMQPYTDGHADKAEFTSSVESQEECVLDSCYWSSQWMTLTEPASIVHLHCVLHGNEDGGKPSYCWSLIFCIIAPVLVHRSMHPHTHTPTHPNTQTHTLTLYARELHHFKGFNLRTKKMAGGGKLEGEHGCFFRRRGSTSEGPLISHNPAKLNTRTKRHHAACVAISRCKI